MEQTQAQGGQLPSQTPGLTAEDLAFIGEMRNVDDRDDAGNVNYELGRQRLLEVIAKRGVPITPGGLMP